MVIPAPPEPFTPAVEILDVSTRLYRVHRNRHHGAEFNPGVGSPSRFAFVVGKGGRKVPSLYAAQSQDAAVAETILHDIPVSGGIIPHDKYAPVVMSRLSVIKSLRLAVFHGLGLRQLGVTAQELSDSSASTYPMTLPWAQAAYDSGLAGCVWMSRLCNNAKAYVLFGDRCAGALGVDPSFARMFATGSDLAWLIDLCAPLNIDVLPPR